MQQERQPIQVGLSNMYFIDIFINTITMYRLVLYYLIVLVIVSLVFGLFGILPYAPVSLLLSLGVLLLVSWATNALFSKVFVAPTNSESVYITACILFFILTPLRSMHDLPLLVWAAVWAMASKYICAIGKKHMCNPVAIAVVIVAFGLNQSAIWWVGTTAMLPLVIIGGLLLVRKIQKEALVLAFFVTAFFIIFCFTWYSGGNFLHAYTNVLLHSSLFFLAFVMLTEPLTTPPKKRLQIMYGALVGFLFVPQVHIGNIYTTPELSLVIGNVFSYLVSPKQKLFLFLKEKTTIAHDIFSFSFGLQKRLLFIPGQYMEWTLPHAHVDSRGNRRYFTIASSPTEESLLLGVKFYPRGSSFKKALATMDRTNPIVAAQVSGEFILPDDPTKKCVFIAGGIGITPFRSMIKYLIDTSQKRTITLFYMNKTADDIVYTDVFDKANDLGISTIYTITDTDAVPKNWQGNIGRIDANMIQKAVPDYTQRLFYLSGPHVMVTGFAKTLQEMGIKKKNIKKDYFPGFA